MAQSTQSPAKIHIFTSNPKLSTREGAREDKIYYAYYNARTSQGGECTVCFPEAVKDFVKQGTPFSLNGTPIEGFNYTTRTEWSEQYKATFLLFDFASTSEQEIQEDYPFITNMPEDGWKDSDNIVESQPIRGRIPRAGVRAPSVRKKLARNETEHAQRVREAGEQLDPHFKRLLDMYVNGQIYAAGRLGCREPIRQDTIQKHVTSVGIAYVDYMKSQVQDENVIDE